MSTPKPDGELRVAERKPGALDQLFALLFAQFGHLIKSLADRLLRTKDGVIVNWSHATRQSWDDAPGRWIWEFSKGGGLAHAMVHDRVVLAGGLRVVSRGLPRPVTL